MRGTGGSKKAEGQYHEGRPHHGRSRPEKNPGAKRRERKRISQDDLGKGKGISPLEVGGEAVELREKGGGISKGNRTARR